MSWEMPQIIFPKQELAKSHKQLSKKTKQNKTKNQKTQAMSENQHILRASHINDVTSVLILLK